MCAGEDAAVTLHVDRLNFNAPIRLTFKGLPDGVTLHDIVMDSDKTTLSAKVTATIDATPCTRTVTVTATTEGKPQEETFVITVTKSSLVFRREQGWLKTPDAKLVWDTKGNSYYDKIDVERKGEDGKVMLFRFHFILCKPGDVKDLSPFYIMQKQGVRSSVPAFFAATGKLKDKTWEVKELTWDQPGDVRGDYPQPRATGIERKSGGRLSFCPLAKRPFTNHGPVGIRRQVGSKCHAVTDRSRPKKDNKQQLNIAVNRDDKGPMKCGEASDDESPFGCRDMSGNGLDWTRNLDEGARMVPLPIPPQPRTTSSFCAAKPLLKVVPCDSWI